MIRLDNAANDLHIPILHNGWRNTVCNLHKYILQFGEIHLATLKHAVIPLDNTANDLHIHIAQLSEIYILQFTQIQFAIYTNTFSDLEKYTLQR